MAILMIQMLISIMLTLTTLIIIALIKQATATILMIIICTPWKPMLLTIGVIRVQKYNIQKY